MRLRDARVNSDLTQVELARRLRVSARSIQDWEAARSFPQPRMRRKLERFFERVDRNGGPAREETSNG